MPKPERSLVSGSTSPKYTESLNSFITKLADSFKSSILKILVNIFMSSKRGSCRPENDRGVISRVIPFFKAAIFVWLSVEFCQLLYDWSRGSRDSGFTVRPICYRLRSCVFWTFDLRLSPMRWARELVPVLVVESDCRLLKRLGLID